MKVFIQTDKLNNNILTETNRVNVFGNWVWKTKLKDRNTYDRLGNGDQVPRKLVDFLGLISLIRLKCERMRNYFQG